MIAVWLACAGDEGATKPGPPTSPPPPTTTDSGWSVPCVPDPEVVANGQDDDCDGFADELGMGEPAEDAAALLWLGDVDNTFGAAIHAGADLGGGPWVAAGGIDVAMADRVPLDGAPGLRIQAPEGFGFDVGIADCASGFLVVADISVGQLVVYSGSGDVDPDDASAMVKPLAPFGIRLAELDGTPEQEVVVGSAGTLWVYDAPVGEVFGPPRLTVTSDYAETQNFAYQVGEVGDLTGDGVPEITAYREDDWAGGRAWIMPGDMTGTVLNTDVGWSLTGEEPNGEAGFAIALGDIDGDGYLDLATGAALAAERGGVTYVYPGPIQGDGWLADGMARFTPAFPNDWCGHAVDTLADQDGDGRAELLIGCPRDEFRGIGLPGRVELYAGARVSGDLDAASADRIFVGRSPYDGFGWALLGEVDATGDGAVDLLVGAPWDTENGTDLQPFSGAVYVIPGPLL